MSQKTPPFDAKKTAHEIQYIALAAELGANYFYEMEESARKKMDGRNAAWFKDAAIRLHSFSSAWKKIGDLAKNESIALNPQIAVSLEAALKVNAVTLADTETLLKRDDRDDFAQFIGDALVKYGIDVEEQLVSASYYHGREQRRQETEAAYEQYIDPKHRSTTAR